MLSTYLLLLQWSTVSDPAVLMFVNRTPKDGDNLAQRMAMYNSSLNSPFSSKCSPFWKLIHPLIVKESPHNMMRTKDEPVT